MAAGLRVVRGPDWNLGDKDGGNNHVGTITGIKGPASVTVTWDMGGVTVCRAGDGGKYDLRILDNAPIGVLHDHVTCCRCDDVGILGTRWQCATCRDSSLCTPCYFRDGHDTAHAFKRIDFPGSNPVQVPKRSISQRARALGMFPNATAVRGPDWQYKDQDGGSGREGTVVDLVLWGHTLSNRNAVRVNWAKGGNNIYRLGANSKIDLTCKEQAPGPDFYPDHLAPVDLKVIQTWAKTANVLKVGDKVFIGLSKSELKQLQQSRGQWNTRMEAICGEIGEVEKFMVDGNIAINFDGETFKLNKAAVSRVSNYKQDDKVRTIESQEKAERLQKGHGGWDEAMTEVLGKVGTVLNLDTDGDVAVRFGDVAYVFNPACLVPAPGEAEYNVDQHLESLITGSDIFDENEDTSDREVSDDESSSSSGDNIGGGDSSDDDSDADGFAQALAGLMLLGLQAGLQGVGEKELQTQFVQDVADGNCDSVEQTLQQHPDFIKTAYNGLTMVTLAVIKGHKEVVGALLDAGTNINYSDPKQMPALMCAIKTDQGDIARYLIERGANVNIRNAQKQTALHLAAQKNMVSVIKLLLEKNCDVNAKDDDGDTPLHDAILNSHESAITILINCPKINLWTKNNKKHNVLAHACLKGNAFAVDKIVGKLPGLVNAEETKASGDYYPLHIAAINNHLAIAGILLSSKGNAEVDALTDTKSTALHLAAIEGYYEMVELLLQNGADWKRKNIHGNTALHLCLGGQSDNQKVLQLFGMKNLGEENNRINIAQFLIKHGASIEETNNDGKTPLQACPSPRMVESVKTFAEKNKATRGKRPNDRPSTASVRKEVFITSIQKCLFCTVDTAVVRFLPCNHVVTCQDCCYECKLCPVCQEEILQRRDKDGRPLIGENCNIS